MCRKLILSSFAVFVLLSAPLIVSVEADSLMWSQSYGGSQHDEAYSLIETSDGGYVVAGDTRSFGEGLSDFWLIKTDAYGAMEWNKTFGGPEHDSANSLVETSDGGYAIAGYTYSFGSGGMDAWLIRTNPDGSTRWKKTYGDTGYDIAKSMVATSDGGYVIIGITHSFSGFLGDMWLIKVSGGGNMEWNKTYGGEYGDEAYSVVETSDGGYAFVGITCAIPSLELSPHDVLLVKTDEFGIMEWNQTFGPTVADRITSLVETSDGGYAMAGYTTESLGDGFADFVLIKTDELGNIQWKRTYGGPDSDWAASLVERSDGGYAIAGTLHFEPGVDDIWVVKTDMSGNMEWNQTYGGTEGESCRWLIETSDGGYAFTGEKSGDFWLIKTDEYGVVPEYSSWLLPSILLAATLVIVVYKKKPFNPRS